METDTAEEPPAPVAEPFLNCEAQGGWLGKAPGGGEFEGQVGISPKKGEGRHAPCRGSTASTGDVPDLRKHDEFGSCKWSSIADGGLRKDNAELAAREWKALSSDAEECSLDPESVAFPFSAVDWEELLSSGKGEDILHLFACYNHTGLAAVLSG